MVIVSTITLGAEEWYNKTIPYPRDIQDITTPFRKIVEKLSDINSVLNNMLGKLTIIAEKNATIQVNVEPAPITIEPNIIVNPNITFPERECKWEKLNQQYSLEVSENFGCCGFHSLNSSIQLPHDIVYNSINVISGAVLLECGICESNCLYLINGVSCGSIPKNSNSVYYELPAQCINAFHNGRNTLTISVPSDCGGEIHQAWIEMEIKPSNC